MRLVHTLETKPQPWRNGAGQTRDIAVESHDDGAPGWRVSLADVERGGPFSEFPGMQRIFTLASGELALLTVDGQEHALERFRPLRFDGGAKTTCALPTGAVKALNVFTDPERYAAGLIVFELSRKQRLRLSAGHILVLLKGQASIEAQAPTAEAATMSPFDAVLDAEDCAVTGRGFAALISIMAA
ncbi:HutD family protein [Arthrobacter roseus]|uniref:HutD/Ves family protein n=1 Tax=Arthrobacter roseus TaxID=136274 RepID=UPI00196424F6|nr:HutD family protein [Arthrobacter roseus]MBM7849682.1 environmental stress-induced protein Ves [Arthrobacter roseus]